eukprot:3703492-Amphidinium_carterae.1
MGTGESCAYQMVRCELVDASCVHVQFPCQEDSALIVYSLIRLARPMICYAMTRFTMRMPLATFSCQRSCNPSPPGPPLGSTFSQPYFLNLLSGICFSTGCVDHRLKIVRGFDRKPHLGSPFFASPSSASLVDDVAVVVVHELLFESNCLLNARGFDRKPHL